MTRFLTLTAALLFVSAFLTACPPTDGTTPGTPGGPDGTVSVAIEVADSDDAWNGLDVNNDEVDHDRETLTAPVGIDFQVGVSSDVLRTARYSLSAITGKLVGTITHDPDWCQVTGTDCDENNQEHITVHNGGDLVIDTQFVGSGEDSIEAVWTCNWAFGPDVNVVEVSDSGETLLGLLGDFAWRDGHTIYTDNPEDDLHFTEDYSEIVGTITSGSSTYEVTCSH